MLPGLGCRRGLRQPLHAISITPPLTASRARFRLVVLGRAYGGEEGSRVDAPAGEVAASGDGPTTSGPVRVNAEPKLTSPMRRAAPDARAGGQLRSGHTLAVDSAARMTVRALGARVEVRVEGASAEAFTDDLARRWRRCLPEDDQDTAPQDTAPDRTLSYVLGEPDADTDALRRRITIEITAAALDHCKGTVVTLHAAGLEDGAVAYGFVGPSGAGKSTLASRLGSDWGYAGDEAIGIDAGNAMLAFPKPLALRPSPEREKDQVSPDDLDLRHASGRRPLAALFLLDRRADPDTPVAAEPAALIEALTFLTGQTSYLPALERPLQRLAGIVGDVGVYRLTYRDSRDQQESITRVVRQIVGARAGRDVSQWSWTLPEELPMPLAPVGTPAVRRVRVGDAVQDAEGTIVVLRGADLHVLSPLGSAIWEMAADWVRPDDIGAELARLTGVEPDAELVEARLRELVASGLLESRN